MPIKFNCPECKKPLSVKEHLAGKKAKCPSCQKPITIPAPVSQPADVEDLAAQAFADEPKAEPVVTKTVDFTCPQCDAELHLPADMAGKNAPCPECKRIIKVPQLKKEEPIDWRTKKGQDGPTGVRRQEEQAPEGAWGTAKAGGVSRQSLEDAGAVVEPKEEVTPSQWARRGIYIAVPVLVLAGCGYWFITARAGDLQRKTLADALGAAKSDEAVCAVRRAAGEFELRNNTKEGLDKAMEHFRQARAKGNEAKGIDKEMLLFRLARTQLDLEGTGEDLRQKTRLDGGKTMTELSQTLGNLPIKDAQQPLLHVPVHGARVVVVREICRELIKQGKEGQVKAHSLAAGLTMDEMRGEIVGQVGLDLARANYDRINDLALGELNRPGKLTLTPSLIALCLVAGVTNERLPKPPRAEEKFEDATVIGYAVDSAYKGNGNRKFVDSIPSPEIRFVTFVLMAAAAEGDEALKDFQAAVNLLGGELKGKGNLPFWPIYQLALVAHEIGQTQALTDVIGNIPSSYQGWIDLVGVEQKIDAKKGVAADTDANLVSKDPPLPQLLAKEKLARHNARADSGTVKSVAGWGETERPYGLAGAALGLQDGK
jgi:hypothetical protein